MTTTECSDGVTLVFNHTPLWILCGVAGVCILLAVAVHVREWLKELSDRKAVKEREEEERETILDAEPRREALELIAKLDVVREKMLELDRALTQRREGARWQFRIGDEADHAATPTTAPGLAVFFPAGRDGN